MIPKNYSSEGVILARKNLGEADRILIVYSKNYGKLPLLAKGVRKPKSRKRGSLEVFGQIKFSAVKGKTLDLIIEAETINSFGRIRKNLKKVSVAYYFMEVIGRLTRDEEKNPQLYYHLINGLSSLENKENDLANFRKNFSYETLVLLGFWPRGKSHPNPDALLEEVIERKLSTVRVGKRVLS